jgi:hypothetical protein
MHLPIHITGLTLVCCLLLACTSDPAQSSEAAQEPLSLAEAIPGRWETIEVRTEVNSYEGRDTSFVDLITEADWRRVYAMKPIRITFLSDGSFVREHELSSGEMIDQVNGNWGIYQDSIIITSPQESQRYGVRFEDDKMVLEARLDWDRDGAVDDYYRSVHRLTARATR